MSTKQQYGPWIVISPESKTFDRPKPHVKFVQHEDKENDELCVIKTVNKAGTFLKEVETTVALEHPYIIEVIDHSLDKNNPYVVTKYMDGGTLMHSEYWKWDSLTLYEFGCRLYDVIEYVYSKGFQRGDDNTHNILVRWEGNIPCPVLIDFESMKPIENFRIHDAMSRNHKKLKDSMMSDRYAQMLEDRKKIHSRVRAEIQEELKYHRRNYNRCCE